MYRLLLPPLREGGQHDNNYGLCGLCHCLPSGSSSNNNNNNNNNNSSSSSNSNKTRTPLL